MITETPRLIIRNWQESDAALFHHINSNEMVMEFFAIRRDRSQSDELMHWLADEISKTGYGFFALQTKDDGQAIGFAGLSMVDLEPHFPASTVEIGWRLGADHWGRGYATEAAQALLRLGFEERGLDEIVAFAVPGNRRSIAVMERLGMRHDPGRDFDHPRVPDSHPHLQRHVLYALRSEAWRQRAG
jgi:RimJ/RimL family protein N-acetyltransferase